MLRRMHRCTARPCVEFYGKLPDTRDNRRRRIAMLVQQVPAYLLELKIAQYEQLLLADQPIAESVEDDGLLGRFYGCVGQAHWFMGRVEEGLECENKSAALCEKVGDMGGAAFAYTVIQYLLIAKGDCVGCLEFEAPCLRAEAVAPNLRVSMWALTISGWALGCMGSLKPA